MPCPSGQSRTQFLFLPIGKIPFSLKTPHFFPGFLQNLPTMIPPQMNQAPKAQVGSPAVSAGTARLHLRIPPDRYLLSQDRWDGKTVLVASATTAFAPRHSECLTVDLRRGEESALQTCPFSVRRCVGLLTSSAWRDSKASRYRVVAGYHHLSRH